MAMRPRTFGGANNSTANRQRGAVVRPVYEDFKPKSEWIQNQESDNLLIYLPGFTKESLKVSTEGRNIIKVRGEHLVTGNKWQRFQEDFHAPDYCNIRGIRARFEGGILTITVPKNTITPPPKEVSKPIDKPTTSQKPSEILPAKPPQIPKDPLTQNVQETIPPKITALKEEDKEKHVQESIVPPKPISPLPSKVPKEPLSQKVQENIPPKITALKEEDKEKHVKESIVPPKPISHLPSKVPKEPLSQKVQENVPPKINAPNNNDKAKTFQESPVSSNPISSVADDKTKYDQTFSKQEKLPKKSDAEQKQKVDSGASKEQETMNETKLKEF
ncbi:hypothetical protein Leryth_023503 [Lithospermum erythrorhizon]|nr:hypothetical protein Leryth_023503 [Lithospermum erythrorhizon]